MTASGPSSPTTAPPSARSLRQLASDRLLGRLLKLVPTPMSERMASLRRDLSMVALGLAGGHPPPLISRHVRSTTATSVLTPRTLRIEQVVRETADAVTLWLRDPSGAPIHFVPGQFFTVMAALDGEIVRRAYSACSSALEPGMVAITSKRVAGGRMSNFLNEHAHAGMTLSVLGPSGNFTVAPVADRQRNYVLLGGGSGVTPLLAITRAVLAAEPLSHVTLILGNRRAADIIFRGALSELAGAHPERFSLRLVLEEPPADWHGGIGQLGEANLSRELDRLDAARITASTEFMLCGPAGMMAAARAVLRARGILASQVREERFGSPHLTSTDVMSDNAAPQSAEFHSCDRVRTVTVHPGETLLEAGLRSGAAMPFSCAMGGCGSCKVKLDSGQVRMQEPNCLTPEERAGGYVLACIASPCSQVTVKVP